MSQYDLMLDLCFFIHLFLFDFFFLVYIISILLLTYDKGHRLCLFYIYSIYIKFGVKSLLSEGGDTGWGYT